MKDRRNIIQKDIVNSLSNPSHGILLLAPRVGKTKIAIDIIKKEKPKSILWVTLSTKLRDVDIPQEFSTWKAKRYLKKTKVICWGSLHKEKGFYDKIILDEFQELTVNNSRCLLDRKLCSNSILCLSGTYPKDDIKQSILSELKLNILKEIDIEEAVEEGLISDYKIKVVEVFPDNSRKDVKAGNKNKSFLTTEKRMYDYLSDNIRKAMFAKKNAQFLILKRMHLIYNSITKENVARKLISNLEGRKLIFAGSIEQSNKLCSNTYNSKTDNKDLDKFMNKEIDSLCCVKSGGVGFTYKDVDHFIIVQSDSDKKGETTQRLCRALLSQKNYVGQIWFICLVGTKDEEWLEKGLSRINKSKVQYLNYKNL